MEDLFQGISVIDAHQHFWDPSANYHPWLCDETPIPFRYGDYSKLRRPYLPDAYLRDAGRIAVAGTVYVETEWNPGDMLGEMRYVEQLRARSGFPTVAVAQAWLDHANVGETLSQLAAFPFVRGIRHKPRANPSPADCAPGGMTDLAWRCGYANLAEHGLRFDLQTPWWHLHEATTLAQQFPDTQIILNHAALPADRSADGLAAWRKSMTGIAACPNVAVKISGLGLPGRPWRVEENRDIVLATIDMFGVDRCMFASNFPVDGLVASFDVIFAGYAEIVRGFSLEDRKKLFHDNAMRIYEIFL